MIAQGIEAGGHVRGNTPMLELLARTLAAVKIPVLAAGGIIDREGVAAVLEAGAAAAVVGTRFLVTPESHAHPEYKRRCQDAERTILTELFGLGWPGAPHRVIANAATKRWLSRDGPIPGWIAAAQRLTRPLAANLPDSMLARALARQRSSLPLLSPQPPTDDGPDNLVDSGPLYAGEGVGAIREIQSAAEVVSLLTP